MVISGGWGVVNSGSKVSRWIFLEREEETLDRGGGVVISGHVGGKQRREGEVDQGG